MILPIITTITREVLLTIPSGQREASIGLGATKWETIKNVILKEAKGGITGAVILGPRACPRRNDGGCNGYWQQPKNRCFPPPARLHDACTSGQHVQRSPERSACSSLPFLEIALILFGVTVLGKWPRSAPSPRHERARFRAVARVKTFGRAGSESLFEFVSRFAVLRDRHRPSSRFKSSVTFATKGFRLPWRACRGYHDHRSRLSLFSPTG